MQRKRNTTSLRTLLFKCYDPLRRQKKMNKEESDLIIAEQNKSTEEILKAVAKVKSDYHELCNLKDMRIAELEYQLTHRNCLDCSNHSSKLRMRNLELEKENTELKAGRDINVFTKQLTKAKGIISEYINILNGDTKNWKKTQEKAEQFLNGENIILEDAQVGNSPFDADEVFNKEMKAYPEQFFKD